MAIEFTPTKEYLPEYYKQCKDMTVICDALDDLYFRPFYTDVCLKSQIYGLFRNDLATEETLDPVHEDVLNRTLGISGAWADPNGALGERFPVDWPQRRICVWLLMTQLVSHPSYTRDNITQFITSVERLLRFYAATSDTKWMELGSIYTYGQACIPVVVQERIPGPGWVKPVFDDIVGDIMVLLRRIAPINIPTEVIWIYENN